MVTVYSLPNCVQCRTTKRVLDAQGTHYREVMLHEDEAASEYVKSLGYQQAPVVVVDEKNHWSGLDPVRLSLLNS